MFSMQCRFCSVTRDESHLRPCPASNIRDSPMPPRRDVAFGLLEEPCEQIAEEVENALTLRNSGPDSCGGRGPVGRRLRQQQRHHRRQPRAHTDTGAYAVTRAVPGTVARALPRTLACAFTGADSDA